MASHGAERETRKRQAAHQAAALVRDGMVVGLGTGSTAAFMIEALICRVRDEGLRIVAVPTSERSAAQAVAGGIVLADLGAQPRLDLTIDGADQIVRGSLALIKGMGGALLREKIVAAASDRLVIISDDSKLCARLDLKVPVEVARFGWQATLRGLEREGCRAVLRQGAGQGFVTDGGNHILDCDFGPIADPAGLDARLHMVVGVVETGLFIDRADEVLLAGAVQVERLTRT